MIEYQKTYNVNYSFRYDVNDEYLKEQNINTEITNKYGNFSLSYLDSNSKVNNVVTKDTETINYRMSSNKFLKFSKFEISGLYDLQKEINTE